MKLASPKPIAQCRLVALLMSTLVMAGGCTLIPETRVRDSVHNPFPQLKTVAVLPFFNQSESPTLDGREVALAYYAALQAVPGFEVVPVGVTEIQMQRFASQFGVPVRGEDFQRFAQMMDVEAVIVGSVTDFDAYYPPRMAMTVRWYAANPGFHQIPAGYGLPWGTDKEDQIPARIVREAEFELARSQLKTQTPQPSIQPPAVPISTDPATSDPATTDHDFPDSTTPATAPRGLMPPGPALPLPQSVPFETTVLDSHPNPLRGQNRARADIQPVAHETELADAATAVVGESTDAALADAAGVVAEAPMPNTAAAMADEWAVLPAHWPNPTDLIPDPPAPVPPPMIPNTKPVLTHTRLYRGDDPYFTARLADYVETGDDARGASWQGYVRRSEDFIRFCCHLHLMEMLEARGGKDPSDLILQWPVSRY